MTMKQSEKNKLILISMTVFLSYLSIWFVVSLSRIAPMLMTPDRYFSSYIIIALQYVIFGLIISILPYSKVIRRIEKFLNKDNPDEKLLSKKSIGFMIFVNVVTFLALFVIAKQVIPFPFFEPAWSPTTYALVIFLVFLWCSNYVCDVSKDEKVVVVFQLVLMVINSAFVYLLCRQFVISLVLVISMVLYLLVNYIIKYKKRGLVDCALITLSGVALVLLGILFSGHFEKFLKWISGTLVDDFYVDSFLTLKLLYIRNTGGMHPFASVNTYYGIGGLIFMGIFFTIIVWMCVCNCIIMKRYSTMRMNMNLGMYIFFIIWFICSFLSDIEIFPAPGINFVFIRYAIVGMVIMTRNNVAGITVIPDKSEEEIREELKGELIEELKEEFLENENKFYDDFTEKFMEQFEDETLRKKFIVALEAMHAKDVVEEKKLETEKAKTETETPEEKESKVEKAEAETEVLEEKESKAEKAETETTKLEESETAKSESEDAGILKK